MAKKATTKKTKTKEKGIHIDIKGDIPDMSDCKTIKYKAHSRTCGGVYGVGIIGAMIYFVSTATSFWAGVLGILKSLVWPAFMVYGLLKMLGL